MGALTRLDGEDRELARWLRAHRRPHEPVMIEPLAFADIGIAHAAGVPWTESVTLIVTREPRATVADSMRATGARFLVGYDRRRTGWPRRLPDWPQPRRAGEPDSAAGESSSVGDSCKMKAFCGNCKLRGVPQRSQRSSVA